MFFGAERGKTWWLYHNLQLSLVMSFPQALFIVPILLHHNITSKEICVPHFYLFQKSHYFTFCRTANLPLWLTPPRPPLTQYKHLLLTFSKFWIREGSLSSFTESYMHKILQYHFISNFALLDITMFIIDNKIKFKSWKLTWFFCNCSILLWWSFLTFSSFLSAIFSWDSAFKSIFCPSIFEKNSSTAYTHNILTNSL